MKVSGCIEQATCSNFGKQNEFSIQLVNFRVGFSRSERFALNTIPFSIYDFFAYLSSGTVILVTLDYIWKMGLLDQPKVNPVTLVVNSSATGLEVYVTCEAYAKTINSNMSYHNNFKAYYLGTVARKAAAAGGS